MVGSAHPTKNLAKRAETALERRVRARAGHACEYCRLPQSAFRFTSSIDHIIAEFHRGKTQLNNLAVACLWCNVFKGTNLSRIDPVSREIVPLFHPRKQAWVEHFQWGGSGRRMRLSSCPERWSNRPEPAPGGGWRAW